MAKTFAAYAADLNGPWGWVDETPIDLCSKLDSDLSSPQENGMVHENFQIDFDGQSYLLSTDYRKAKDGSSAEGDNVRKQLGKDHQPWLYRLANDTSDTKKWLRWDSGRCLEIP